MVVYGYTIKVYSLILHYHVTFRASDKCVYPRSNKINISPPYLDNKSCSHPGPPELSTQKGEPRFLKAPNTNIKCI